MKFGRVIEQFVRVCACQLSGHATHHTVDTVGAVKHAGVTHTGHVNVESVTDKVAGVKPNTGQEPHTNSRHALPQLQHFLVARQKQSRFAGHVQHGFDHVGIHFRHVP